MDFIKWGQKQVRQFALNLTETEIRTEEATNNDPWGPHGSEMSKLAQDATDPEKYREIMGVIARRLNDTGENWRHVYKALLLLEHLIKHGPIRVAKDTQANADLLRSLQSFEFKDKTGRDQGLNVRTRAKQVADLVADRDRLEDARDAARINRDKYRGASKTEMKFVESSTSKPIPSYNQITTKKVIYEPKEDTEVDPFEATRKRIEKLKASEKEETEVTSMKVSIPQKKEPKRLSQVKVNPEIAATFVKLTNTVSSSVATPATSEVDLLGGLEDGLHSTEPAPSTSFFTQMDTPNDEWADFTTSISSVSQTKEVVDPFEEIFTQMDSVMPVESVVAMKQQPQQQQQQQSASPEIPAAVMNPPSPTPLNGFVLDSASWTTSTQPMNNLKSDFKPGTFLQSNGGAIARGPGAPMNPNAVQRRTIQKEDPFAGLGFI
eukprot:g6801.t1